MKLKLILVFILLSSTSIFSQKEWSEYKKGQFRLKLSLPYFNYLSLKPNNSISKSKAGFVGEGIGLEYSYHEKRFVEFNFSLVGVVNHPLPLPFDIEGEYSTIYTQYFSLTNNFQKNRFTFGYGINYSKNTFSEGYRSFIDSIPSTGFSISNKTIGVTLNSYYRFGKAFNIGLIYRPTYFRKNEFVDNQLEHLVSLELLWRIRLNKK